MFLIVLLAGCGEEDEVECSAAFTATVEEIDLGEHPAGQVPIGGVELDVLIGDLLGDEAGSPEASFSTALAEEAWEVGVDQTPDRFEVDVHWRTGFEMPPEDLVDTLVLEIPLTVSGKTCPISLPIEARASAGYPLLEVSPSELFVSLAGPTLDELTHEPSELTATNASDGVGLTLSSIEQQGEDPVVLNQRLEAGQSTLVTLDTVWPDPTADDQQFTDEVILTYAYDEHPGYPVGELTVTLPVTATVELDPEVDCTDGNDNDGDGAADCLDRDCACVGRCVEDWLPDPADNLLVNASFEMVWLPLIFGVPDQTGVWTGDQVTTLLMPEFDPAPEGTCVLQYLWTSEAPQASSESASELFQAVDVSGVEDRICAAVQFSRTTGDDETDNAFHLRLMRLDGDASDFPDAWSSGLPQSCGQGPDCSWEQVEPDAGEWLWAAAAVQGTGSSSQTAVVELTALENVVNDTEGFELDGNYADDAWLFVLP